MKPVGLDLRYLVSDRAKASIKLALKRLGHPSVPDLFHALRDLARPRSAAVQRVGGHKGHDTRVQQRLLTHLSAQTEGLRADQATYTVRCNWPPKPCIP